MASIFVIDQRIEAEIAVTINAPLQGFEKDEAADLPVQGKAAAIRK